MARLGIWPGYKLHLTTLSVPFCDLCSVKAKPLFFLETACICKHRVQYFSDVSLQPPVLTRKKGNLREQRKAPHINEGKGATWEKSPFTRKEESSQ